MRLAVVLFLALLGCDTRNATWTTSVPSPTSGQLAFNQWSLVSMSAVKARFRRCSVMQATYDIGDASEEREVAIEPWVYDLLFPAECEVRLLVDAPNMKITPVRGGGAK